MTATKGYKGIGMHGMIATWYANSAKNRMDQFREWARRSAELTPGREILEVAPGPGYVSIEIAKLGAYRITGLDISDSFVKIARSNAESAGVDVDFRLGNASEMPFPDSQFDFVFCSAAFKNFTDPVGALREMYRVLKPGGKALIIDLRKDASLEEIDSEVNRIGGGALNKFVIRFTFRNMLLKRAYVRNQIEQFVSQTKFRSATIGQNNIGMEILLTKQLQS
jgi:ubiquinone/menaquinone biosynthesis C-methylase UbiE